MSEPITLTLPASVYRQAEIVARDRGRPVEDVLVETIERSLRPTAPAETATPSEAEEMPWPWRQQRRKARASVREFSEGIHGDH